MEEKKINQYIPIMLYFSLFYVFNRLSYMFALTPDTNLFMRLNLVIQTLSTYFFGLPSFDLTDLLVGAGGVLLFFLVFEIKRAGNKKNYRKGIEYGSAEWGTQKDIEPFLAKDPKNKIILSETESIMINEEPEDPKNQRNRNVLIVGGSGSGKTRFILKPNLLQMNSSYVITDPKGDLIKQTGNMFLENGFRVKVFNTIQLLKSMKYNPFMYITSESDILKFVDYLIANTTDPRQTGGDGFWKDAERLLYLAYIGYMFENGEPDEFNFNTLIRMINESEVSEQNESYKNIVDRMFEDHGQEFPDSFAYSQYKKYKLAAGKTTKSILIQAGARLAPFDIRELRDATEIDELELHKIGDEKTVLYLMVSDTSPTYNFLVGILYSQMFNILIEHADNQPNNRLKIPVQFDLDEFANIGKIPNFEKLIATMRSRGMNVRIYLQSKAQLKANYKDEADTIIGNCDSEIFLGGREGTTLKELSENLGKETVDIVNRNLSYGQHKSWSDNNTLVGRELLTASEISVLDNGKSVVQIRGVKPFLSNKFDLTKHRHYSMLSDHPEDGKVFDYETYIVNYRKYKENLDDDTLEITTLNREGKQETYEARQNENFDTRLNFNNIANDQMVNIGS